MPNNKLTAMPVPKFNKEEVVRMQGEVIGMAAKVVDHHKFATTPLLIAISKASLELYQLLKDYEGSLNNGQ